MPVTLSKIDWKVISGIPQDAPSGVHDFANVEASYYSVCTSNLKYKLTGVSNPAPPKKTQQHSDPAIWTCFMEKKSSEICRQSNWQ